MPEISRDAAEAGAWSWPGGLLAALASGILPTRRGTIQAMINGDKAVEC